MILQTDTKLAEARELHQFLYKSVALNLVCSFEQSLASYYSLKNALSKRYLYDDAKPLCTISFGCKQQIWWRAQNELEQNRFRTINNQIVDNRVRSTHNKFIFTSIFEHSRYSLELITISSVLSIQSLCFNTIKQKFNFQNIIKTNSTVDSITATPTQPFLRRPPGQFFCRWFSLFKISDSRIMQFEYF